MFDFRCIPMSSIVQVNDLIDCMLLNHCLAIRKYDDVQILIMVELNVRALAVHMVN